MTESGHPSFEDDELTTAASVLADAFGLGDDFVASKNWPVDDGDRVLAASFSGDRDGEMLLAVNADVCGRLLTDPQRLAAGFQKAIEAIQPSSTVAGDVETVDRRPTRVIEVRDKSRVCCLFGIELAADVPATDGVDSTPSGTNADASDAVAGGETGSSHAIGAYVGIDGVAALMGEAFPGGANGVLLDIDVEVAVELGRIRMPLSDVLSWQVGSVIEIGASADAPVEMMVGTHCVGAGDVVVTGERFGVRLVDVGNGWH